jgi:hypothetical protein
MLEQWIAELEVQVERPRDIGFVNASSEGLGGLAARCPCVWANIEFLKPTPEDSDGLRAAPGTEQLCGLDLDPFPGGGARPRARHRGSLGRSCDRFLPQGKGRERGLADGTTLEKSGSILVAR